MSVNDGGPAFPVSENYDERRGETITYASEGMSLRDYFAAKAMAALIEKYADVWSPSVISVAAHNYADAMLRARGAQ